MPNAVPPAEFLDLAATRPLLDVRAPGEYAQGHIPGAVNAPLFSDAERTEVGILYKQSGKDEALLLGLKIAGPRLEDFVRQARELAPGGQLALHCWRGGQRSGSMAWLFRQAGFEVHTLAGGYKAYRQFVLGYFEKPRFDFFVLGGQTGAGKTKILRALRAQGEQILDLEALAHHKGSAFGSIGEAPQPTVEQFENELFAALTALDPARRVWVENESRSIGRVYIPQAFWQQLKSAPLLNIEVPFEARIRNLVEDYAAYPLADLEAAFLRIDKKLGGQHLRDALEALHRGDFDAAAAIALRYYDKTYRHCLENNPSPDIRMLSFAHGHAEQIALECRGAADGKTVPFGVPG